MNKNNCCTIVFTGFFIFASSIVSIAGNSAQKNYVNSFLGNNSLYEELFTFFNEQHLFTNKPGEIGEPDQLISQKALDQARLLFDTMLSDIINGKTGAVMVVTLANRNFYKKIHPTVEQEFPASAGNEFFNKMNQNDDALGALSISELAEIGLTAFLTGPKVGFDLMSGGAAKTIEKGSAIAMRTVMVTGPKLHKILKINVNLIKKVHNLFKACGPKTVKWTNKLILTTTSHPSLWKLKDFLDSNQFKLFVYIGERFVDLSGVTLEGSYTIETNDLLDKIKEIEGLNERPGINSEIVQKYLNHDELKSFFVNELGGPIEIGAQVLGNKYLEVFINLLESGVISILTADKDLMQSFNDSISDAIQGGTATLLSLTPVVGAFYDTFAICKEAAEKIETRFKRAQADYTLFMNSKRGRSDMLLDIFKLAVIEDTFREVLDNNNLTKSILWPEMSIGNYPSPRFIQSVIFDYEQGTPTSRYLFKEFKKCQFALIKSETDAQLGNEYEELYPRSCDTEHNFFSIQVNRQDGEDIIERGELYFDLKKNVAYYFQKNKKYNDVKPADYFYKYIMALSSVNAISGQNGSFYPQRNVTQGEFIKIISKLFYYNKTGYGDGASLTKYYSYLSKRSGINFPIDNVKKENVDVPITRGEVATIMIRILQNLDKVDAYNSSIWNIVSMEIHHLIILPYGNRLGDDWSCDSFMLKKIGVLDGILKDNQIMFEPNKNITRANISKIISNAFRISLK